MGAKGERSGFTVVEFVVAMPLVLLAAGMFLSTMAASGKQRSINREQAKVGVAIQEVFEEMRNEDFRQLFALYNEDPFDDPNGPGTAPGPRFSIPELRALPGSPDGQVGEIRLPFINTGDEVDERWEVREDLVNGGLGLPRDLNGDSIADANDHAEDYSVLPVEIVVRWQGRFGPRDHRMQTLLADWRLGR